MKRFAESKNDSNETERWNLSENKYVSVSKLWNDMKTEYVVIVDFRIYYTRCDPIQPTKWGIAIKHPEWEILNRILTLDDIREAVQITFGDKIKKVIENKATEGCYGCSVTHPSQIQHMSGGCLSDWEDKRDAYLEESFRTLNRRDITEELMERFDTVEKDNVEKMVNAMSLKDIQNIL